MKKRIILAILAVVVFCTVTHGKSSGPVLGPFTGVLDGKSIFEYTMDEVTDKYRSPSGITVKDAIYLYYASNGLCFVFDRYKTKCIEVMVYVIPVVVSTDDVGSLKINSYTGTIDRDQKLKQLKANAPKFIEDLSDVARPTLSMKIQGGIAEIVYDAAQFPVFIHLVSDQIR